MGALAPLLSLVMTRAGIVRVSSATVGVDTGNFLGGSLHKLWQVYANVGTGVDRRSRTVEGDGARHCR
jgi:hypothetical protein